MEPDPASLDNLHDIVVPPAVPPWPPAPGWWFVIALAVAAAGILSLRAWRAWRANAYRRAALSELEGAPDLATAAEVLKRTALAAFPRTQVAGLTGPAWCEWLEETAGQAMPEPVRSALADGVFADGSAAATREFASFATLWITSHRAEPVEGRDARC